MRLQPTTPTSKRTNHHRAGQQPKDHGEAEMGLGSGRALSYIC